MSKYFITPLEKLIENFESLPGIGSKTALRLAYSVLKMPKEKATEFAHAIIDAKNDVHYCKKCYNFTDKEICNICADSSRDIHTICVVEDPRDVTAIEKTQEFHALYHVLHGTISPLNGIGPEQIRIRELLERVHKNEIKEVIVATNPTVEGEATSMYISKLLKPQDVVVTRLAYGIPVGATLEYADEITLSRALKGRREV